jgi:hypothetical protein
MNQYPYYLGRGDILVDSDPQGARIYVDRYALLDDTGNILVTPATVIDIMEGIHEIQISMDRYYSKKIFILVMPNKNNKTFTKLIPIS